MNKLKLRLHFCAVLFLMSSNYVHSQVGIGTATPNASAALDIFSSNRGLLIPRISLLGATDTTTINSPATSLLVYNTSSSGGLTPGFYFWNGSVWTSLNASSASNSGWNTNGNNITSGQFLGTTNFQSLVFRVNNTAYGQFHPNGGISIGRNVTANNDNAVTIGLDAQTTSTESIAIGASSIGNYRSVSIGQSSQATSSENVLIGFNTRANYQSLAVGSNARANGTEAVSVGQNANASGYRSIVLGKDATASQNNSIAIGFNANATAENSVAIGNSTHATQNNSIILGRHDQDYRVGIGTNTPQSKLHVNGTNTLRYVDGNQANGRVLTSDANGVARWAVIPSASNFRYRERFRSSDFTLNPNNEVSFNSNGVSQGIGSPNERRLRVSEAGVYKVTYSLNIVVPVSTTPVFHLRVGTSNQQRVQANTNLSSPSPTGTITLTLNNTKILSLSVNQEVNLFYTSGPNNLNILEGSSIQIEKIN